MIFNDIVLPKIGFLRGPFGGDLKKDIFVIKGPNTYKIYEQGVVLQKDNNIGNYYITKEYFDNKMSRFEVNHGDFLVSCSGINLGAIFQIKKPYEKGIINQALLRIRLNNKIIDDNYFYYYFNIYLKRKILSGCGDSTIPNFPPLDLIKKISVNLPAMPIQQKIGKILSNFDRKIILNNTKNTELEKLAKTIYTYWFLQFDFPNKNGKPYKSSGGKLVYNEELKREIPKDWSVAKLDKLLRFEKGTEVGSAAYREIKENDNFVKFHRVADIDGYCSTFVNKNDNMLVYAKPENIVVTFDGSVGKIGLGLDGAISSGLQKIYAPDKRINNAMVWQIFNSETIQKTIQKYSSGSILKHASGSIEHLAIPYDEKTINIFQERISPFYSQILVNKKQNIELAALRDFLLPLLMNGQVKVLDK